MKTKTLIVACLAASVAMAAQTQDGVLLRRVLKEGDVDKYRVTFDTKQLMNIPTGLGEQDLTISGTMLYTLKIGKIDASGTAEAEATTTVEKTEAGGSIGAMMPPMPTTAPIVQKGKLDVQNRLKLAGTAATMMATSTSQNLLGLMIEFPQKAVKQGDTWEILVPKSPVTASVDQKLIAKLKGEADVSGQPVWVLGLNGTLKTEIDQSKMGKSGGQAPAGPFGNAQIVANGTMELDADVMVAKATGRTVSMVTRMKNKTNTTINGAITIDATGTGTAKAELVK